MIPGEAARAANHARFARLVARPEPDIDLALGALMIAAEDRPDLEFDPTLAALDVLADRVRLRLDRGDSTDVEIERLHDVLYREWGFRPPNAAEYHATGNSQLDRVIERRIGLPITLSIVELEVAWRLGIAMHGIGLPLHRGDRTSGPLPQRTSRRHRRGGRQAGHRHLSRPTQLGSSGPVSARRCPGRRGQGLTRRCPGDPPATHATRRARLRTGPAWAMLNEPGRPSFGLSMRAPGGSDVESNPDDQQPVERDGVRPPPADTSAWADEHLFR